MAIFWGFVLPLLIIILVQLGLTLPLILARLLSLLQEAAGVAMLAGTLYLLKRRIELEYGDGAKEKQGRAGEIAALNGSGGVKRVLFPMIILLIVLVSGFLAESSRFSLTGSDTAWASPVGWVLSLGTPASPLFMQMMIRLHFFAVLLFMASIPFTFMRHLVASPLNLFYKPQEPKAALREIDLEVGETGAETIKDFSWKQRLQTDACVSCGRCEENCPAFISGKPLSPRKVIGSILEQAETTGGAGGWFFKPPSPPSSLEHAISDDEIWACTTCMACVEHCPVCVAAMDKIVDMRRYQVMGKGALPPEARPMIRDLELYKDVYGKGASHRSDWAMHRDVPRMGEDHDADILFWVGCSGAFHPRNRETTLAMVKILKAAGMDFGILAEGEMCCGDPARKLGEEALFQDLARQNIRTFEQRGVKKILTPLSPLSQHP